MTKRREGDYRLSARDRLLVENVLEIVEHAINERIVGLITLDNKGAAHVALAYGPSSLIAETLARATAAVEAAVAEEQKP